MSFFTRRTILASALAAGVSTSATAQIRAKRVRIIVCLADNKNQGIVPTTAALGNGQNARNNLYWGALYGVKSHFRQHEMWKTGASGKAETHQSEHIIDTGHFALIQPPFSNDQCFISAEAWDGKFMKQAIRAFYDSLANTDGGPDLIIFVGHNVLMDFRLFAPIPSAETKTKNLTRNRAAMVFACNSADYFTDTIRNYGVNPAVMTHGLMAPEAYSIEPAIRAWFDGKNNEDVRRAAAGGYAKYQRIPERNARRLFGVK